MRRSPASRLGLVTLRLLKKLAGQHLRRRADDHEEEPVFTFEPELHLNRVGED